MTALHLASATRVPAVAARNISKRYGGIRALAEVSVEIWPGTVHALLGENGAGKSTLVKILSGAVRPDEGIVEVAGKRIALASPAEARRSGIAVVHQELSLFPQMKVLSNVFAGSERHGVLGWMHGRQMRDDLGQTMDEIGWSIPLDREVGSLPLAEQQMVEIVRAFHFKADLVLLDEPNSSFTEAETRALYDAVRRFRARGQAFLLVSHRIDEVLAIADHVTILRDGRVVHSAPAEDLTVRDVVNSMVGSKGKPAATVHAKTSVDAPLRLGVSNVSAGRLRGCSLALRQGEVVGVAGLDGSGVQELFDVIFGTRKLEDGSFSLDGRDYRPRSPADAIRYGVASIPADRRTDGLMMNRAVAENIVLVILGRLRSALGMLKDSVIHKTAQRFVDRFRIRIAHADVDVVTLSGGNQQKVVLAKWLALKPTVLLLNDPTRGIDVGAKAEVHDVVRELAAEGVAILVWSSESDELLGLCDRIVVLVKGAQSVELDPAKIDRRELLLAIMGERA
jgi:ribose transport system ATP-binding protein